MKRVSFPLVLLVAAALGAATRGRAGDPPPAPVALEETLRKIVASVAPAIVRIEVDREDSSLDDPRRRLFADPESLRRGDAGSGMILRPDGLILTHRSVVLGAKDARIVVATDSGRRLKARVIATDRELDVALLSVDTEGVALPAARLGTADGLVPGRFVVAVAHPFGISRDARASSSIGIVEGIARLDAPELVYAGDAILTDAAVNPGSEGGALVDAEGRVVGLLLPIVRDRRSDAMKAPVVPMDAIVPRLEVLARGGSPGKLGVLCAPAERDRRGLRVSRVIPGSGAEKAGLKENDRIAVVDGNEVDGAAALLRALEKHAPGKVVKVVVEREGARLDLEVTLGEGS